MKKLLVTVLALLMFTSGTFANVDEKVLAAFHKAFPSAENIKWSEDKKGYFVSFTQLGISTRVALDPGGGFLYSLRYYQEENLPVSVLLAVKEQFKGKKIFAVIELSTADDVEYHIKLEDAEKIYGIRVSSSGSIAIEEHFKRSD